MIHLAGAPLLGRRWTAAYQRVLHESRVALTQQLVMQMYHAVASPRVLISASAVGYYGDCGDTMLDELAPVGSDWLAGLCADWESAAAKAAERDTRVVQLRTGIVLGHGGALQQMLPAYRMHLGGRLGTGRQFMPWIHMEDVLGAIKHILYHEDLNGPVNLCAPEAVRNRDFSRLLSARPGLGELLPVPAFGLRLLFGKAAQVLLSSQRTTPRVLQDSDYRFQFTSVEAALHNLLP